MGQTQGVQRRRCIGDETVVVRLSSTFLGAPSEGLNREDKADAGFHFTSCLNRLVRTRMLGGVGAGEGDLPGYPIRPQADNNVRIQNPACLFIS